MLWLSNSIWYQSKSGGVTFLCIDYQNTDYGCQKSVVMEVIPKLVQALI